MTSLLNSGATVALDEIGLTGTHRTANRPRVALAQRFGRTESAYESAPAAHLPAAPRHIR